MSPGRLSKKPRVVALGNPKYIDDGYLNTFADQYDFSVLEAYDRKSTQELLPKDIEEHGPIDAFIIRMGTPPYEPFDEDLLKVCFCFPFIPNAFSFVGRSCLRGSFVGSCTRLQNHHLG